MPQVIFLPHEKFCPEGMVVEAETGISILELAHEHHIEMESACGGVCAKSGGVISAPALLPCRPGT